MQLFVLVLLVALALQSPSADGWDPLLFQTPQKSLRVSVVAELSPNDVLAVGNRRGGIHLVDLRTGAVRRLRGPADSACTALAWNREGSLLAARVRRGGLTLTRVGDASTLWSVMHRRILERNFAESRMVAFADEDRALIVAGAGLDIFAARDGSLVRTSRPGVERVTAFCVDTQGRRLAVGTEEGLVRVEGVADAAPIGESIRVTGPVNALAFSPTQDVLAVGAGDALVRIFTPDGACIRLLSHADSDPWGEQEIGDVEFSRDGKRLLSSTFTYWEMRCWDVDCAKLVAEYDSMGGLPVEFPARFLDEDRRMLASRCGVVACVEPKCEPLVLDPKAIYDGARRFAWTVESSSWEFRVQDVRDGKVVFSIDIADLENDEVK